MRAPPNSLSDLRQADGKSELSDWRHSDLRNMAFLYTCKVFEKFVDLGGLDQ